MAEDKFLPQVLEIFLLSPYFITGPGRQGKQKLHSINFIYCCIQVFSFH